MGDSRKDEAFNKRIKEPYNEAWLSLTSISTDNSDAAWNDFSEKLDHFHERLSKASTPHEFSYLRYLYHVMLEAGEVIGEIHRTNGNKAVIVAKESDKTTATL